MDNAGMKRVIAALRKNSVLLAVIFLGAVLLLLPRSCGSGDDAERETEKEAFSVASEEARMAAALSRIDGAGEVTVVLSLRSGEERIVASDGKRDGERETVIISTGSSTESPVTLKTVCPEYRGVLIVAEGAGSPTVERELKLAAAVLTGLTQDKIAVAKMK